MSAESMVAAMEALLGLGEFRDNTNKVTEWYGLNGQPWCDQAITYAAWHSGNQGPVVFGGKYAYTPAHAQAFADHGEWHPMTSGVVASGIRRGDVVFFDWSGGSSIGGIDHVGLVTGTNGATVYTVEGNVENGCRRKVRGAHEIAGFGRPAYTGSNQKPAPPAAHGLAAFPGTDWFRKAPNSATVTAMGKRLVAVGCGRYSSGPGPQWSDADRQSYAAWQRRCGLSGSDADGFPGKATWDRLKVPVA